MVRHIYLAIAVCAALLAGDIAAQEPDPPAEVEQDVVRGETIDSGYVILNGRYLPPPYTPEKRGNELWINDQLASSDWFARPVGPHGRGEFPRGGQGGEGRGFSRGGPGGERGFPRGGPEGEGRGFPRGGPRGPREPDSPERFGLSHVTRSLENNALLIAGEDLHGCILKASDAAATINFLVSEKSPQEKLDLILADTSGHMDKAGWQRVIATFVPADELMERMGPELERVRQVQEDNDAKFKAALASAFWRSQPVKYVITLLAMGLVVAACGTLLNYRPESRGRWSEIDAAGDGIPIVVRSVVLLVLLGIFDLACTLVAQQAGGFTEMNPLASRIVANPLLLTVFKLTTLLMACSILYALRRYRGAQVASWWMCLLCTVLTFRWLTYNSMFMS